MLRYVIGAMLIAGAAHAQTYYNPNQFNPQPPQQTVGGFWNNPPAQTVIVQPPPTDYQPPQANPFGGRTTASVYLPPGMPGTPTGRPY